MIHSVYQNRRGRYKGQRGDFVRALKLFAVYARCNGLARRAEQEQRGARQHAAQKHDQQNKADRQQNDMYPQLDTQYWGYISLIASF